MAKARLAPPADVFGDHLAEEVPVVSRRRIEDIWGHFQKNVALLALGIVLLVAGDQVPLRKHPLMDAMLLAGGVVLAAYAIVNTYATAGREAFPKDWQWFQPLKGGVRFVALQIAAWTTFFFFIMLPLSPFVTALYFPEIALGGFRVAAAVLAVLTQIVMISR